MESPKADFKVQYNTVTLDVSDEAVAVATGTIGTEGHDACPLGLGIISLVTPLTPMPIVTP